MGKGTGPGGMNKGQHKGVSDGNATQRGKERILTHKTIGDRDDYNQGNHSLYTESNMVIDLNTSDITYYKNTTDMNRVTDVNTSDTILYSLIIDKSSHNNTFSHSNNRDNNKTNTIHRDRYIYGNINKSGKDMSIPINEVGDSDDHTQVDCTTDSSRHKSTSRTNNIENNQLIYRNTGGTNTTYTQGVIS